MAYATTDDVQAYFPANSIVLSVSTSPTLAEVEGWIASLERRINKSLKSCGYETIPVTGVNDIGYLKDEVAKKIAARTWEAYYSKQGAAIPAWVTRFHDEFDKFMEELNNCDVALQDQTPADSGSFHVGYATLYSETYSDTET